MSGEDVTFERACDVVKAYFATPEGAGSPPGLVLIPDVRGLVEHYRDVARRFATEGFCTLAVDLYSREGAPELPDMAAGSASSASAIVPVASAPRYAAPGTKHERTSARSRASTPRA